MRILIVTNLFPPYYLGGYELLCGQVVAELRLRGHEVAVLTSVHGVAGIVADPADPAEPGIHRELRLTTPFDEPSTNSRLLRSRVLGVNKALARARMAAFKPDLVFVWSQLRITVGAVHAARELGLPMAFTMNDEHALNFVPVPLASNTKRLAGWLSDRTVFRELHLDRLDLSHVACISAGIKERLVAGGLPVPHARVIYQSIPLDGFPPRDDPGTLHRPARLLFVGQLHAWKGVHVAIAAMKRLVAEGREVVLTIAGEGGAEYTQLLRTAAAPLENLVVFKGKVPYEVLSALYREHDMFLFPSTAVEGFGLTFLEAMASGLPVVATDGGGHGEVLRDGRNALIFPEGDDEALALCISRILDDCGLRARLARNASEEVRERFNFRRYMDEIEEFLVDAARYTRPRFRGR